ncbi:hypothetical protein [Demequina sp. NBRC 110053]|uniref:hypothetical protein n=1 Tax=Demequina sp. NBRC 110053 TaxID=1570342 RepID=UPI001F35CFF6|nr:hypothetical protein [Demequina sp. NBRC 110053]
MLDHLNAARRRLHGKDEGVAMLSVLMLVLILTSLAIILVGVTLTQTSPTLFQEKNVRTLAAAQAGLDAAAFQIRNAYTGGGTDTGIGDIHKLPCSVSGSVEGDGSGPNFVVDVAYYAADPEGQTDEWLVDNELTCYPIAGASGGLREVPRYAILTSEGFDPDATVTVDQADRIVRADYTFQLTTRKIAGGRIFDDGAQYCWVAESTAPGANVRYRSAASGTCDEPTDFNSWTWADDYMIHLSSTDENGAVPMCLSGRHTGGTPARMTLQPCTAASNDPLGQRFAWTGSHTWRGQNSANTSPVDSYIINQDNHVDNGDYVSVGSNTGWKSVSPDAAVGKGNASYATDQVVNQSLFGRCLDVTDANLYRPYNITYPCKQDPSGGDTFDWNHKWYYAEPGDDQDYVNTQITVRTGGNTYCLITTDSTTHVVETGTNANKHERFPRFLTPSNNINCTSTTTTWKRYGYHDDDALAYHFVDSNGRCLSSDGPRTTSHPLWNTVVVEACSDSESQMWNVPADPVEAALSGFEETTGREAATP